MPTAGALIGLDCPLNPNPLRSLTVNLVTRLLFWLHFTDDFTDDKDMQAAVGPDAVAGWLLQF